jgi:hypothetical protein
MDKLKLAETKSEREDAKKYKQRNKDTKKPFLASSGIRKTDH